MKIENLIGLKREILFTEDQIRLLELNINLKQLKSVLSYRTSDKIDTDYNETDINEFRRSIYIIESYLDVIRWKLEMIKLDKEIIKINAITINKNNVAEILDIGFQKFLNYHLTNRALKEENAALKHQLNRLKK